MTFNTWFLGVYMRNKKHHERVWDGLLFSFQVCVCVCVCVHKFTNIVPI